jgi:hypothetical protein
MAAPGAGPAAAHTRTHVHARHARTHTHERRAFRAVVAAASRHAGGPPHAARANDPLRLPPHARLGAGRRSANLTSEVGCEGSPDRPWSESARTRTGLRGVTRAWASGAALLLGCRRAGRMESDDEAPDSAAAPRAKGSPLKLENAKLRGEEGSPVAVHTRGGRRDPGRRAFVRVPDRSVWAWARPRRRCASSVVCRGICAPSRRGGGAHAAHRGGGRGEGAAQRHAPRAPRALSARAEPFGVRS